MNADKRRWNEPRKPQKSKLLTIVGIEIKIFILRICFLIFQIRNWNRFRFVIINRCLSFVSLAFSVLILLEIKKHVFKFIRRNSFVVVNCWGILICKYFSLIEPTFVYFHRQIDATIFLISRYGRLFESRNVYGHWNWLWFLGWFKFSSTAQCQLPAPDFRKSEEKY